MDTTQLSMEELGGSSKHSPSPDLSFASPAPPTASRRTTLALVTLIASSTFSSFTVQRSRLHSLRVLLALPIAQWSLSLAYLWSTLRRERTTGRGGGRREWAIGALLAISGTLRIWEARMLPFAVWSGFEVLLIGLLTVTRNSEADSSSARRIAIASILVAVVGSIFVGGGPQSARGVAVSIAQVGATGFVWISIENIGELSSGSSATTIAASALISHILIYLYSALLHFHDSLLPREPRDDIVALVLLPFATSAAFLSLLSLTSASTQLLKISSNVGTIFIPARNLLVLALGSYFGLGGGVAHALEPFLATTYLLAFTVTTIIILRSLTLHSQPHLSPPSKIRFILPRLALLPFILFTLISLFPSPDLPLPLLSHYKNSNLTIDLVIAHYDTPLPSTSAHISHLLHSPFLSLRTPRIFFYEKGSTSNPDLWDHFPLNRERGDEVVRLDNFGREGATYLRHILRLHPHRNTSRNFSSPTNTDTFADYTLFAQSHLAWEPIALRRLDLLHPSTGFLSLGPYRASHCGSSETGFYQGTLDIWRIVRGRECGREQTTTWAGQFVVSRKRIERVGVEKYEEMSKMLEAPDDDPIHQSWGPNNSGGQSNPAFGHSVERSWPLIFDCDDPALVRRCDDLSWKVEDCQCSD